jgi:hypothetical protein
MKMIKAELWEVYVCEGTMVHGHFYPIKEYYIPDYKIAFNIHNDGVNIFSTSENRYSTEIYTAADLNNRPNSHKMKNVMIPEKFAKSLKQYLDLKEQIKQEAIKVVYGR